MRLVSTLTAFDDPRFADSGGRPDATQTGILFRYSCSIATILARWALSFARKVPVHRGRTTREPVGWLPPSPGSRGPARKLFSMSETAVPRERTIGIPFP